MFDNPSDLRLLAGIEASLRSMIPTLQDPAGADALETISAVIAALATRRNPAYRKWLLENGASLLAASQKALGAPPPLEPVVEVNAIAKALTAVAGVLGEREDEAAQALLREIVEWEVHLWDLHVDPPPSIPAAKLTREAVETCLRTDPRWSAACVESFHPVPGGYSKSTIMIDVRGEGGGVEQLVVRAEQALTPFLLEGSDVRQEFHALRAVHATGLPVAEPVFLQADPGPAGVRFLVSRRLLGKNEGNYLGGALANPLETLQELAGILARIHAVRLDPSDRDVADSHLARWLAHDDYESATRDYVGYWRDMAMRSGCGASPAIQRGFDWLQRNVPRSEGKPVLIHGDYGLHNIVLSNGHASGVIDWESSICGDPADDFANFFGAAGAYATPSEVYGMYRAAGGHRISQFRLNYFQVLACMKPIVLGQASLDLLAREPDANLKYAFISYRYVAPILAKLNDAIAAAESVPDREAEFTGA